MVLDLFERRIAPRVTENTGGRNRRRHIRTFGFGQAKIKQSDPAVRRQFKIVRLDIAMDNLPVASVQIDQCVEQLIGPGNHGAPRKRARLLGNNLSEVSAGDELHYQKCPVAFREIVTDARQRRMMELRQQARLLLKLSPETLVNRKGLL